MRHCREMSLLVSRSLDERLPLKDRVALGLHLAMCRHCAKFSRQVRALRTLSKKFLRSGDDGPPA